MFAMKSAICAAVLCVGFVCAFASASPVAASCCIKGADLETETFQRSGGDYTFDLHDGTYAYCAVTTADVAYDSATDTISGSCRTEHRADWDSWLLTVRGDANCTFECIKKSGCTGGPVDLSVYEATRTLSRTTYPYCAAGGSYSIPADVTAPDCVGWLDESVWGFESNAGRCLFNCLHNANVCESDDIKLETIDVSTRIGTLQISDSDFPFCAPVATKLSNGTQCNAVHANNSWTLEHYGTGLCQFRCIHGY